MILCRESDIVDGLVGGVHGTQGTVHVILFFVHLRASWSI